MKRIVKSISFAGLIIISLIISSCGGDGYGPGRVDPGDPIERDLANIGDDTLTALLSFNSTSYFLYRGEPMGFEYELLQAFAEDHDIPLKTVVVRDLDSLFFRLNRGDGDVIAARLIPTVLDEEDVAFTEPLYETQPALIQRSGPPSEADLPDTVDSLLGGMEPEETPEDLELEARLIQRPKGLTGKEVTLPTSSQYLGNLVELTVLETGDIEVVEVGGDVSIETLVRRIARGEMNLTVSQENIARLRESYFENISVTPTLGEEHGVAWAVRENAPELLNAFNAWIEENKGSATFAALYDKYFRDRRGYQERVESEYLTSETGQLSAYDPLLKTNAREIGWDWRLLASQAYQESRFDPDAQSWAGAIGLLQLMPPTAREVGVQNPRDPEQNVEGAVTYLEMLRDQWEDEIPDPENQIKFILASYNAGRGHILDAQRLTEKNGGNPNEWEDVAYWLLQLSKRQYYTDPVVRYGFVRGMEPVTYVAKIMERFQHYQQFVES